MKEVLLNNVLYELEDSHIAVRSVCRVLRHRAPDHWSKQDEEEVISQGTNEALGRLQEMVAERSRMLLGLSFLECLRVMEYNLDSINKALPIKQCVLWFVPSPLYAAKVVYCTSQSKSFESGRPPFFWHSEQSSVLANNNDIQFLYRYCGLFGNSTTELILIYPQEYNQQSIQAAITGAMEKWQRCTLIIYSTLGYGLNLLDTIIINDSTGFSQGLLNHLKQSHTPVWLNPIMHDHKKQRKLYYQMIWLCHLITEIIQFNTNGIRSQFLDDLKWNTLLSPTSHHNESIVTTNLSYFKDELFSYISSTRLWHRDESCYYGITPIDSLQQAINSSPVMLPSPLPPLQLNCQSSNASNSIDLHWFNSILTHNTVPVISCYAVNQLYPNIAVPKLTNIAIENCCHLTIECILYMNQ